MDFFKSTFYPDEPLVVASNRNKEYLQKAVYVLLGYIIVFIIFIFSEGFIASLFVLLQLAIICSAIFTLYYGMFAVMTGFSVLNLFYMLTRIQTYNSVVHFILTCFFVYSSYYSFVNYRQMRELYLD